MKKLTWAEVKPGDVVELGGRGWSVVKIKPKGKKAKLEIRFGKRESKGEVKLADRVKIIERRGAASVAEPALHDAAGAQTRWAKKSELKAAELDDPKGLPAGDAKVKKPPAKAAGGSWEKPKGDAEKMIVDLLSARLVGESHDESAGYYVPPVDVSTVAAHLELFHGGIPERAEYESAMLDAHAAQHILAAKGEAVLAVNHWHTAKRP